MWLIWEVQYILAKKKPTTINFRDLRLKFERVTNGKKTERLTPEEEQRRREEATEIAKARWGAILGGTSTVKETKSDGSETRTIRPGEKILLARKKMIQEQREQRTKRK